MRNALRAAPYCNSIFSEERCGTTYFRSQAFPPLRFTRHVLCAACSVGNVRVSQPRSGSWFSSPQVVSFSLFKVFFYCLRFVSAYFYPPERRVRRQLRHRKSSCLSRRVLFLVLVWFKSVMVCCFSFLHLAFTYLFILGIFVRVTWASRFVLSMAIFSYKCLILSCFAISLLRRRDFQF